MNKPLVSICIPSYNASSYIADTIKSVLDQTYDNLEINISDDCSTDSTLEVVRSFADSRIKIHSHEQNVGASGNYNQAMSYATGKYIKLLCADDLISPDCIEKQVRVFEENPDKNIVLVTAEKNIINDKGKYLFKKGFHGKGLIDGKKAIKKSFRSGTNIFGEPGLPLMLASAFSKTDGIITDKYFTYCNDFDLWCQMLLQGNLFVIKEPLFSFRIVSTSVTSNAGWKQAKIMKDYFDLIYQKKVYELSKFDVFVGKFMIILLTFARNIIYKLI